ncbi:hypothetical protein [Pseudoduganella chitinolytica]|uniref:Uncharacterized protein n=1 Tax=Pseudoduganella chitinolytica TaxID=34070 RepID=A0ABY8BFX9_9BURK|nr:hypothetical protein [Pseudoduganella chitinolytica]WEF34283.1 hypothetical protein PX653_05790 [Pseudoduganella chitinolytica]
MRANPSLYDRMTPWVLLCALLCCYPLSQAIPPAWVWENGIVEEGDVLVLSIGWAWAVASWLRDRPAPAALLARSVMPLWVLLIGREMSWGAVLFAPDRMTAAGPVFTSHHLWYRPFVTPLLAALLAWSAWSAWRCRLDRQLYAVLARGRFPWMALLVVLAAALGSSCAEEHVHACLVTLPGQRFEELAELVGYVALVAVQARVLAECRTRTATLAPAATAPVH